MSDDSGGKAIEDVYRDRNLLAVALAEFTHAPSGWKPDSENPGEWAIVWIETPCGQVSWHVPQEMAAIGSLRERDAEYEGYDREIKNDRLAAWISAGWC